MYSIPFNITKSTKLQNLQFRITHRFFPTKRYLCVRSVVDDPFCDHCGEIETIQHLFLECEPVRQFWNGLVERINPKLEVRQRFNINKKNVIFGSLTASPIANFIVLYAKQFIVTQRFQDQEVTLNKFVSSFEKMYQIELCIAGQNGRLEQFKRRWEPFIDSKLQYRL